MKRAKTEKEAPHLTGMKRSQNQDPAQDPTPDLAPDLALLVNVIEGLVGPGSESGTVMVIGSVTSGAPAERGIGNTGGGEGQPLQKKMINLPLRSLQ